MKTSEIEKDVSLDENAPIEEEKEIEHKLNESFLIINFASCTSEEMIAFMLDFFDLIEDKLLHFYVIYFATVVTVIAAWAEEIAWIRKRTIRWLWWWQLRRR